MFVCTIKTSNLYMHTQNQQKNNVVVAVVDDDRYVRDGLSQLLNNVVGMKCSDTFDSPEDFLSATHAVPPDLLLLDVSLNGSSGIDAIPVLRKRFPEMVILMHSNYDDHDNIIRSRRAGAGGYIFKNSSAPVLYEAILEAVNGVSVWPPGYEEIGESTFRRKVFDRIGKQLRTLFNSD